MVDQLQMNTRSPDPDDEIDDPLAELARIIGYERPAESARTSIETPDASEFDLEAELMRELDVPLAPSVDELDRIEADEALDQALTDGDLETEPAEIRPQQRGEPLVRQMRDAPVTDAPMAEAPVSGDPVDDDRPDVEPEDEGLDEARSSGALLRAIENEFPVEDRDDQESDEPASGQDDFALAWNEDDLAPDWLADKPADDADDDQTDHADDDQTDYAEPDQDAGQSTTAKWGGVQTAAVPDHAGDDVLEDMVRFELPQRGGGGLNIQPGPTGRQDGRSGADAGTGQAGASAELAWPDDASATDGDSDGATSGPSMDFEEYLSTELDVFGHEVALEADGDHRKAASQFGGNAQDEVGEIEAALDLLSDDALDADPAVFDAAAEELLASLSAPDAGSGPDAGPALAEGAESQDWSLDSIEESSAEKHDGELGDMFGLPDRVVDPSVSRTEDDLELDLGQVLADSFNDIDDDEPAAAPASQGELEPEPGRTEAGPADRDDLTEAFAALIPSAIGTAQETGFTPSALTDAAGHTAVEQQPDQHDWLAGFDEVDGSGTGSAPGTDSDDYYFDAELIADADEAVEPVGIIDVPELVHDDPQPLDPDYDPELEGEFADFADRHEPQSEDVSDEVMGTGIGVAEEWSRSDGSQRGSEVSDDYIALERELGAGHEHPVDPYPVRFSDDDPFAGGADARNDAARSGSRGPVVAIAVLGIAVVAVAGAFGWSMLSGDDTTADGGPRIIRAETEPVKVLPENPGGVTVPNQDKAVYDRVAGVDSGPPGQPALVNSAEEPVDVVQRTLDPEILPLEGRGDTAVKSEDRLIAGGSNAEAETDGAAAPVVSPRKVRTMIVKPDGSIVAREEPDPVAEAEDTQQLVASAGTVLDAPAETPQTPEPTETAGADAPLTTPAETADTAETAETDPGSIAPVRVVKTQQIRPVANAPVPAGRPADQPINVVGTVSQGGNVSAAPSAAAQPATPAAEPVEVASAPVAAAPAANPGGYYVQIASQPTVEGAQQSWRTLSSRYSSVLGGQSVDIQRADIPGKGVFHRVRVPAGSKDQANALCSRYKSAGGSCFVSR
ncbi:SPOR domain-containing protein [Hoeflea sp. YIM 152468]|uniref:SPOR domain-containing protein n=1 Tax=Hoeflea sp. YIM 152468 TaxID=3031759 RepID=UPI0023DB2DE0|nr:SPOR domain-containing protein [Hoeflea sp. YIM 152468]MDF1609882.1 SPOR domain-containing protein [Hoeflea sp. YIM 152468]